MTLHTKGIPARMLDLLETDGGWLTVHGLAHELEANPESVERALWRLRLKGLVECRRIELLGSLPRRRPDGEAGFRVHDFGEAGHGAEYRTEWRVCG